ncbi:amidohydrolase [candidate division WOR-3 bacterium]|nr:amidohydrolase [candidate division WOR-3 bacterium]
MIDIHTHLGRLSCKDRYMTAGGLLRFMDRNCIDKAVVLPIENPEETELYVTTEHVLKSCRKYHDRLIPFCNIDPRRSYPGRFNPEPLLKEYIEKGCRGFGENLAGLPVDSPLTDILYNACEKLHLPVLLHLDNWINRDRLGLPGFEKVLKRHPRLIFIGHGPAFWREISARVKRTDTAPGQKVFPGGKIDYLLKKYPNLYADLSAASGYNALNRDRTFAYRFLERNRHKLLFGTDYLSYGQKTPIIQFFKEAPLKKNTYKMIVEKNAQKILKLKMEERI